MRLVYALARTRIRECNTCPVVKIECQRSATLQTYNSCNSWLRFQIRQCNTYPSRHVKHRKRRPSKRVTRAQHISGSTPRMQDLPIAQMINQSGSRAQKMQIAQDMIQGWRRKCNTRPSTKFEARTKRPIKSYNSCTPWLKLGSTNATRAHRQN